MVATCGSDRSIKIWNYLSMELELSKEFEESVESIGKLFYEVLSSRQFDGKYFICAKKIIYSSQHFTLLECTFWLDFPINSG